MLSRFQSYSRGYVSVIDARNRKFFFCELMHDRIFGDNSADAAAQAIKTLKPGQVMLEMDEQRFQSAISSIVRDAPMSQPSRVDIVSTVHGGLMTRELKSAVEAAREIDSSIYLVDRPYRITQNRLAEKVLNPYVFANLFNYGKLSLMNRQGTTTVGLEKYLKTEALPIYKVLIEERAQYMAKLIHEQARDDETIVVVCSSLHVPIIESILSAPDIDEKIARTVNINELSRKGLPLWPILVGTYFVLPVSLAVYLWMMAVSGLIGGVKKIILGSPEDISLRTSSKPM